MRRRDDDGKDGAGGERRVLGERPDRRATDE